MLLEGLGVLLAPLLLDGGGQAVFSVFQVCSSDLTRAKPPPDVPVGGLFALVPCHCYFCQWQAVEANYFHYLFSCLFSLSEVKLSVV